MRVTTTEEERSDAIEAIETAFWQIAQQRWEPDRWQRLNLLRAIEDVSQGRYILGEFMADHAMVPLEYRSDKGLPDEALLLDFTLEYLQEAFERAKIPVLQVDLMQLPFPAAVQLIYDGVFAVPNPNGEGYVFVMPDGSLGARLPDQVLTVLMEGGYIGLDEDALYRMRSRPSCPPNP